MGAPGGNKAGSREYTEYRVQNILCTGKLWKSQALSVYPNGRTDGLPDFTAACRRSRPSSPIYIHTQSASAEYSITRQGDDDDDIDTKPKPKTPRWKASKYEIFNNWLTP